MEGFLVTTNREEETMSVLLQIPMRPSPTFSQPSKWSPEIKEFVASCLIKDFNLRPSAKELLQVTHIRLLCVTIK
jgi:serine/threonine protein kinase